MMQDDYDRIQLADWMEDTFPKDAGLDTLIDVCQNIKELEDFAKTLKAEKAKVQKQKKGKNKTALGKRKQDEPSSSQSLSTSNESNKTPRIGNIPKEPVKEDGYHREPKEVMVLKVTEPFTYDLIFDKRMFHATVATEYEFFRVKIFDPVLINKFIPNKIIAISNYFGLNGFLEIYEFSCVSDVDKNRTMDISKTLRKRANATPKIRDLFSQAQGTYVIGEFVVFKKTERSPFIYYGIEDVTGTMEVLVHGRLTNIKCEPGQKLRLICFELSSSKDTWQLKSKQKTTNTKLQSTLKIDDSQKKHQLLGLSATSNSSAAWEGQTLQGLAATASSSLNTPQTFPATCDSLKTSQGSPEPHCQSFLISPVSDSSIHLNSPMTLTLSSRVQTPYEPSSTASSNVWVPSVSSETVSNSLSAPQMSPVSCSIRAQNLHVPTRAAFNSIQTLHNPQTGSGSAQSPRVPATLKSKSQVIKTPPATGSSSVQVPHTLPGAVPKNVSTTQVPQRTTGSSIQTLNTGRVNVPKNVQVPGPLATVPVYVLTSLPSSATASSSLQVLPLTTSNSLPDGVPRPIATSRVQTTQIHPAAASSFNQAPHAPLQTMPRSVCPTQDHRGVASITGQALPCPKVEAPSCALASQMPSATTSESLLAPPTTCLLAPMVSSATTSSSSYEIPRRGNIPKEPAKEEGYHREPKEVMVLKVTEPFTYDLKLDKRMFHATVATENEFYRVKIFDPDLKNKFIPNKIIAISNYFGSKGFLEIHESSCVSDVDKNRTMDISKTLRKRANATPKIRDLFSQAQGTYVSGEFVVYQKTERNPLIYYGIEDDTGKMEVVVHGRLTNIKCEPGQKLRLICFELSSSTDTWQLKSLKDCNTPVQMKPALLLALQMNWELDTAEELSEKVSPAPAM
ncbi:Interferon-activable protein 203 [Microtus ochrogaster]|uniref:Interferon-activable protein 203 n=1 Tax=Microtus ochrogaster TaxID=79684 RepID=A0A8J6GRL6_MICOH|nr:Interferon-activable protein 203 [Microtus ochrogaster]